MIKAAYLLAFVGAVLGNPLNLSQRTDTRIINGANAAAGAYPWQVSLQEPYGTGYWHFCGGSLISQNYIMTAAHCKKLPARVTVYAGSIDKFNGGVRLDVTSFIAHPQYDSATITMDYGIVGLVDPVQYTSMIQAIPIVGAEYDYTSQFPGAAVTSGWGYDNYEGSNSPDNTLPDILQATAITVLSDAECTSRWGSTYHSDSMICAGGDGNIVDSTAGEGVCSGDSGGPLVQEISGVQTLIGATSWAPSSCTTRLPSGWAKLSTVRPWIIDNTDL